MDGLGFKLEWETPAPRDPESSPFQPDHLLPTRQSLLSRKSVSSSYGDPNLAPSQSSPVICFNLYAQLTLRANSSYRGRPAVLF
jgi:hypothetical protein